jgi:hypothetical protein
MDDDAAGMRRSPMSPRKFVRRYLTTSLWFIGLVARERMRCRYQVASRPGNSLDAGRLTGVQ